MASCSLRSAVASLPAPYQPFLVRDDFIVRADLFPLPGTYNGRLEDRHFELDQRFDEYIGEKLAGFERAAERYRCIDPAEPDALADVYLRLFRIFGREYPEQVAIDGDTIDLRMLGLRLDITEPLSIAVATGLDAPEIGLRVAEWIDAQSGVTRLGDALALSCQEDIVIMRLLPDGRHYAESLHVNVPSHWNPLEKYQQAFDTIHKPVADSQRLVSSADNVMKAIVTKGPYVRFGLSMTTQPLLDSHPDRSKPWEETWLANPDLLAERVYVRIERQTTYPMPDLGRALFSVRIYMCSLADFARDAPQFAARLAPILRSASPAVIEYKGMSKYAPAVVDWCAARFPEI